MGIFDRFTSRKGKQDTVKPKAGKVQADDAKQKAFANVPSGDEKTATPEKNSDQKSTPKALTAKDSTQRAHRVLLRPVVTEKSTMGQAKSQYSFVIAAQATKVDVRHAVYHVYGVTPVSVNIVSLPGKWVRYGRSTGRTVDRKKAIVTLPAGKTIDTAS